MERAESTLRVRCNRNTIFVRVWQPFPHKVPKTASLTVGREYDAVAEEPARIKVTNDKGDIASYQADMFTVVK